MDFSVLSLTTPHSHVDAVGTLGSTSAALHLVLKTTSLTEFQPLLTAMGSSQPPVELSGVASFNGTLSGRLKDPQIAGQVEASDLTYLYTPVCRVRPRHLLQRRNRSSILRLRRRHLRLNHAGFTSMSFSGEVRCSFANVAVHHGIVREGNARLEVDGSANLEKGNFTPNSPFEVQATIHDADIAELQRAAGWNYPVTGTLNVALHADGTQANPRATGHLSVASAQAYGRPIKSLTANLVFANHEAQLDDIQLQAMHGRVAGSAAYNFSNEDVHFDWRAKTSIWRVFPNYRGPTSKWREPEGSAQREQAQSSSP